VADSGGRTRAECSRPAPCLPKKDGFALDCCGNLCHSQLIFEIGIYRDGRLTSEIYMESSTFNGYLGVVRKRLWVILLIFAATMAIILVQAWKTPPAYRSTVTVAIIPSDPAEVALFSRTQNFSPGADYDYAQAQFSAILQSQAVARQTLAETGVNMTPAELLSSISAVRDPIGDRVNVSVTTANPDDAEKLLSKQVELAVEEFGKTRTRQPAAMQKFLETELATAERDLNAAQAALQGFKLDNGLEALDRELTAEQDVVRDLRLQQEEADGEAQHLEALADALEQQSKEAQAKAATFEATSDDAKYWNGLARDFSTAAINRRVDAAGQRARKTGAATRLAQHETDLKSLITLAEQHQVLRDTLKQRADNRDFIAGKLREANLRQDQADAVGYLQVLGVPTTPKTQLPARTLQIALLGGAASIVAGIVLVFFLEFLAQSLKRKPSDKAANA
jgi:uncharacterized protein involved in exopolysaccharide biosynthesis